MPRFGHGPRGRLDLDDYERVTGTDDADTLTGSDDDDALFGYDGDDALTGAGGDDVLLGGEGDDALQGDDDDDRLRGGDGNDTLAGGDGEDRFCFRDDGSADTITDFDVDEDVIVVRGRFDDIEDEDDLVDRLTTDADGTVVLELEDGSTITLDGITDTSTLTSDNFLLC